VCGDDERRSRAERGGEARRDEEVRVDDVGMKSSGDARYVAREREVAAAPPSSAVDDRTFKLVAALREAALQSGDEDAEVRIVEPRVHLGDEEDLQREPYPRVTWRMPRHISSVVPSPQRT
jgi:hypothetical protein